MTTAEAIENVMEPVVRPHQFAASAGNPLGTHICSECFASAIGDKKNQPCPGPHPQQAMIDGLREAADFIQRHPDAIDSYTNVTFCMFEKLSEVARRGYGKLVKKVDTNFYMLEREFGPRVRLQYNESREKVCRKVVTGTRLIPAEPEKTVVIAAKPERVEETFDWVCPDSLLADDLPEVPPLPNVAKDDKARPPIREPLPTASDLTTPHPDDNTGRWLPFDADKFAAGFRHFAAQHEPSGPAPTFRCQRCDKETPNEQMRNNGICPACFDGLKDRKPTPVPEVLDGLAVEEVIRHGERTDMICEAHPDKSWPHGDCPGPGMPASEPVGPNGETIPY